MEQILIRKANIKDIKGIQNIHRNCDDPWHDENECIAWVEKRLERGFYIQAAEYNHHVAGHGEWIISNEPNQNYLYLGMLQIDSEFQKRGIGRAMIDNGIEYAKNNNCSSIITILDTDTGSEMFYTKCGFTQCRNIKKCVIPTMYYDNFHSNKKQIDSIPFHVIKELPFVFGLSQTSSRHMWEVCNEKPDTDDRLTPAIFLNDGSYIQLSYFKGNDTALALCWSKLQDKDYVIKHIISFGYECNLKAIEFVFYEEHTHLFEKMKIEHENMEYIRLLH